MRIYVKHKYSKAYGEIFSSDDEFIFRQWRWHHLPPATKDTKLPRVCGWTEFITKVVANLDNFEEITEYAHACLWMEDSK
jgi:hypothetical protein